MFRRRAAADRERVVGPNKQPPGVKPIRMGPSQPWKMPTYRPLGVHLIVEYGVKGFILRVDSGNLTITGPGNSTTALRQGDGYHLPITFQITET